MTKLEKRALTAVIAVLVAASAAFSAFAAVDYGDVSGHWAEAYLERAVTDGYLKGYGDGLLHPDDDLTAAETITVLSRSLKLEEPARSVYVKAQDDAWYYDAVRRATSAGLLSSFFTGFDKPMTRGDALLMTAKGYGLVYKTADLTLLDGYTDGDTVADANRLEVAALIDREIIKGWDGALHLGESLTRAEYMTILYRMADFSETKWQSEAPQRAADRAKKAAEAAAAKAKAEEEAKKAAEDAAKKAEEDAKAAEEAAEWNESENARVAALVTDEYAGDYTLSWAKAHDYDDDDKVRFVNMNGYSSTTEYLVWVNLACQRANFFMGAKGNWQLVKSCIIGSGAEETATPVGVWKVTYRDWEGWTTKDYTVRPVVGFKGGGYAFHSRLKYPGTDELWGGSIGYPVSHGCIRMYDEDILWVYNYIPNGTTVVVF